MQTRNAATAPRLARSPTRARRQPPCFETESKEKTEAALLVDNREWTVEVNVLDFLRDVGKHVTVGTMLSKESVKKRLSSEQGLSFTEFSYMLLQANDFFALKEEYCSKLE